VRLGAFARVLGCSAGTARSYCARGLIKEAIPPKRKGGHWHIEVPLSAKTKAWLWRRKHPAPRGHKVGQPIGDFDPELVELLLFAASHQLDLANKENWPHLHYLLDEPEVNRAEQQVESRLRKRRSLDDLRLLGWAVQIELSGKRATAERLAKALEQTRPTLYRRYGKAQVKAAQAAAIRYLQRDLPTV
jgi:hypothetical protein